LWKNIPYGKAPDSADTRFKVAQTPDYVNKIFTDNSDIKCSQAMPGWTALSGDFIKDFANFGSDPTNPDPPELPSKWNYRIDPSDYDWPVENKLGGRTDQFVYDRVLTDLNNR
jgi:hypothetical protein